MDCVSILLIKNPHEGERLVREFEMDMYTLQRLKWVTNKDLPQIAYGTLLNVMRYPGWRAVWRDWIHVYEWLSLFAVYLKLSRYCLLIGYTPTQNLKNLSEGFPWWSSA